MIRLLALALFVTANTAFADESVCYGTTAKGRLEHGAQLPSSGANFGLSMVFKLVKSAEGRWCALRGSELITGVITGVQFKNGIEVQKKDRQKITA